jgi:hypothetical protein
MSPSPRETTQEKGGEIVNPSWRISSLLQSLLAIIGIKALWLAVAAVAMFACTSRAGEPDAAHVAYLLERTVDIGNCSGVILPPKQDKSGNWHWFIASAAHCSAGSSRKVDIVYPRGSAATYPGREVVKIGRGGTVDMLIIEFTPGKALPYAELAGVDEAKIDDDAVVTGLPARGNSIAPDHDGLVWKYGKILKLGDRVTFNREIWSGNSGGPIWLGKKVLGTASTTSGNESHFTGPETLHKAYHEACAKVGVEETSVC